MALLKAREYANEAEMRTAYATRRLRLFGPQNAKPDHIDARPKWRRPVVAVLFDWSASERASESATSIYRDSQTWTAPAVDIIREVAAQHGVTVLDICGPWKLRKIILARQEAMWRVRHERPLSFPQIGKLIGGRDHTTILHGVRRHQARIDAGEA